MKHRAAVAVIVAMILLTIVTGCSRGQQPGQGATGSSITLAGSTSVQPFAESLAEEYMAEHPGNSINVQGGGSSAGVRAAQSGAAEIGMLSRELKGDEKALKEVVIAYDAIAVVVHPANPLQGLSKAQIQKVFDGEIKNWAELGGSNHQIHVVTREEGSGTRGAFDELIMGKSEVTPWALVQDSNGSVRETVKGDRYAIGYVSLGLVDPSVKAVAVDGVIPSIAAVTKKQYAIVRPFLYVTTTEPQGLAKLFIDFVLGPGQQMLQREGLVPAK
ncbi:MAG: phosphate ABC transporter substrate-binding protein [Bacillota bacterium]